MDFLRKLILGSTRPAQTHLEKETRNQGNFEEMEGSLPTFWYRLPGWRTFEAVTSYLGKKNPFARAFDPSTDEVWLFDNTAFQSPEPSSQPWKAEFVAAFFRKGSGKDLGRVVADLAEKLGIAKGSQEEATVAARLQPFADQILPARTVQVVVEGDPPGRLKLGPSGRSGILSEEPQLPGSPRTWKDGDVVDVRAVKDSKTTMRTQLAGPTGWAIVSGTSLKEPACAKVILKPSRRITQTSTTPSK